jgi:hypothetical protein
MLFCAPQLGAAEDSSKSDPVRVLLILQGDELAEARGLLKDHKFNDEELERVFKVGRGSVAVLLELKILNGDLVEINISRTEAHSRRVQKVRTLTLDHYTENFKAIQEKLKLAEALPGD